MAYHREKQEEFEALMEKVTEIIDEDKFNRVLEQKKLYRFKLQDIIYAYVCYIPTYNPHMFDLLTMEDWRTFADVIDFSECNTIVKYKEVMNKFLRNFPHLRADTLQEVYENLHKELDRINNEKPLVVNNTIIPVPFLNWTPYYGGIISPQLRFGARFRKWAIANSVSYFASPNQAVMTQEAEARYAAGYEKASQDVEDLTVNEPEIDPADL